MLQHPFGILCGRPVDDQEVQQWRLGDVQLPVRATYVPYDPSVETPDEDGANGRLRGIQSVGESSPAECRLPFLSPAESLRPDLRLIHVNCPVATFEASVSSRRPPGDGQAQMRLECSVEAQHRGTTSAANIGRKPFGNIEALWLGPSWQRTSSLRLAMGLTHHFDHHLGLSTEICHSAESLFTRKIGRPWTCSDALPMSWGQKPRVLCLARRHRDDLAIADDLVLPMKA